RIETDVTASIPAPAGPAAAPTPVATPATAKVAAGAQAAPTRVTSARSAVPAVPTVPTAPATTNGGTSFEDRIRTKSSPLVRRMAADHGVEISGLHGSGIAGRVTKKDLVQFLESGATAPPARPGAGAPVHAGALPEPWPGDRVE